MRMEALKKIYWKLCWLRRIDIVKYVYYNFLSGNVVRDHKARIIPYKGAMLELHKTSRLILRGKDLRIGINKIGKSKAETYIRLMQGAKWECRNGASLCYGSTIEVHENAAFETGYFFMNTGSVIIAAKRIGLGEDVLIGRDNVIYDSDFHPTFDSRGNIKNMPMEVCIGDHVWLTNHVMVQKGVVIKEGAVISPFTLLRKNVMGSMLVANGTKQTCVLENIWWSSSKL